MLGGETMAGTPARSRYAGGSAASTGSAAAGATVESAAGSAKTPRSPQLPLLSGPAAAPRSAQEPADGARDGVRDSKAAGLNPARGGDAARAALGPEDHLLRVACCGDGERRGGVRPRRRHPIRPSPS